MRRIRQTIVVLLFVFLLLFAGCQNNTGETWEESYGLPDSGMVLQFTEDGQLFTLVHGYYMVKEKDGNRYLYIVENDEENLTDAFPYPLRINDDNTITLEPPEILEIDNSEDLTQTLQYISGTDGLTSGVDTFEGKYKDNDYDNYEIEFFPDGKYTSIMSAQYKLVGDDKLVMYGEYGKTTYTYEKNLDNGTLRLQMNDTFDVTYFLQK